MNTSNIQNDPNHLIPQTYNSKTEKETTSEPVKKIQKAVLPYISSTPKELESKEIKRIPELVIIESLPERSKQSTESDGDRRLMYGNKAANLFKLEAICEKLISQEGIQAVIPKFHALSHEDILSCLESFYPKFKDDWAEFVNAQNEAKEEGNQGLSPIGQRWLDAIRRKIKEGFSSLENPPSNIQKSLESHLKETKGLMMVRSTGREDTEELALAGGNESIAGVEPNFNAIFSAIGYVVASYFSEQSLTQRLLANQDITQDPFMPVLLQEMIGEKAGSHPKPHEILCCGVAYTQELAGETPDLTVIETAYGHNEAVVNSLVPTDTYYVYSDGMSHEVIPSKPRRLVAEPTSSGRARFKDVDNPGHPSELINKPVLNHTQQQQLQKICSYIQNDYKKPMDIEWIFDPSKNTFYIVQARPLVKKNVEASPSITNKKYLQEQEKIFPGEMIVHRNGETVILKKPDEVITGRDLNDALYKYLQMERDCKNNKKVNPVKAVIVEKMGSALSHPACVFRENEIAVICCKAFDASNLAKNNTCTLLDTQRGYLAPFNHLSSNHLSTQEIEKELSEKGILKKGWFKHPLPAVESIKKNIEISHDYLESIFNIIGLKGYTLSNKDIKNFSLTSLIETLTSENLEEGNKAVKDLIVILNLVIKTLEKDDIGKSLFLERAKTLLLNVMIIGQDYVKKEKPMQRLHAAKRLEALLYQEVSLRILNTDSLRALFEEIKLSKKVVIQEIKLSETTRTHLTNLEKRARYLKINQEKNASLLEKLSEPMTEKEMHTCLMNHQTIKVLAFSKDVRESWESFTNSIVSSRSRIANQLLINSIHDVEDMDILGEWINDQFYTSFQQEKDPILLLLNLEAEIKSMKDFQQTIATFNRKLVFWEKNLKIFEDPSDFQRKWNLFEEDLTQNLDNLSDDFIRSTKPKSDKFSEFSDEDPSLSENEPSLLITNPFQKRILLQSILHGVDVFDKAIKTLRGSPQGDVTQKVRNFHRSLKTYCVLMITWFDGIPKETFNQWYRNVFLEAKHIDPEYYRKQMRTSLLKNFDIQNFSAEQLLPSLDFNAQARCVNSGVDFSSSDHKLNLEELFQIFHQNILAGIACHKENLPLDRLPVPLQTILEALEKLNTEINYGNDHFKIKAEKLNQKVDYPLIITTYNIPVKYHSVVIAVSYDCVKKETFLKFNMFGHNFNNRMDSNIESIIIQSMIHQLEFKEFPIYNKHSQSLEFTWHFLDRKAQDPQVMMNVLFKAIDDSLKGNWGYISIPGIKDIEKQNSKIWSDLSKNPSVLAALISGYYNSKGYQILKHMITQAPQELIPILQYFGVTLPKGEEKNLLSVLPQALVSHLVNDKKDGRVNFVNPDGSEDGFSYLINNPVCPAKRLLFEILTDPDLRKKFTDPFWQEILKHKEALLYDLEADTDNSDFYLMLTKRLISYLKTNKMYDELIECSNFLKNQQQNEGLSLFYDAIKKLEKSDVRFPHQAELLLNKLRAQGITGTLANKEIFNNAREVKKSKHLKPGDRVVFFSKKLNDYYFGRVIGFDEKKPFKMLIKFSGKKGIDKLYLNVYDARLFNPKPESNITSSLPEDVQKTAQKITFTNE